MVVDEVYRRAVEEALHRFGCDKSSLIAVLQEVPSRLGFLPKEALKWIAERMKIPLKRCLCYCYLLCSVQA